MLQLHVSLLRELWTEDADPVGGVCTAGSDCIFIQSRRIINMPLSTARLLVVKAFEAR